MVVKFIEVLIDLKIIQHCWLSDLAKIQKFYSWHISVYNIQTQGTEIASTVKLGNYTDFGSVFYSEEGTSHHYYPFLLSFEIRKN